MATKGSQASDQEVRICMATKGSKHQTRILHGNQGVPCSISGRSGHARDRIGNVDHEIGQSVKLQQSPNYSAHIKRPYYPIFCGPSYA